MICCHSFRLILILPRWMILTFNSPIPQFSSLSSTLHRSNTWSASEVSVSIELRSLFGDDPGVVTESRELLYRKASRNSRFSRSNKDKALFVNDVWALSTELFLAMSETAPYARRSDDM